MGLLGLLGFIIFGIVQPNHIDLHGLRPGMATAEIFLNAHAPLDTAIWGGADGTSIIHFKGVFEKDSGDYRVTVKGATISQVLFVSPKHDTTKTRIAFEKLRAELSKKYGTPEDYHNVYRVATWGGQSEQLKLSTTDRGLFYSVAVMKPDSLPPPSPDPRVAPK